MKNKRFIALTVAFALVFAFSMPAEAQFGNILKKVKKDVERTVKKTVDNASDKSTGKVKKGCHGNRL